MGDAIAMSHRIANELFTVKLNAAVDRLTCNLHCPMMFVYFQFWMSDVKQPHLSLFHASYKPTLKIQTSCIY